MFDSVFVRDSNNSKEFREVPIEVTAKEIYVGSNYKIKWKHVTSLQCKNDWDEDESSSKTLQDYRDEDYERAGFELTCVLDSKKNKQQEEHRTVLVRFPIPPDGQRIVAQFWETFGRALEGGYKKEMRKRQKKLDKEQQKVEEELQEQQIRRKEFSRKRQNRSYSKRPYDFLRKNAANLAHNAEQWTDDEEEAPLAPKVVPKAATEEEDVAASGDESEQEFQDDFGSSNAKSESIDGNSVAVEDDNDDKEDAVDENDDDDDSVTDIVARDPRSSNKRRIKRRGPVLDDSEDEDDDLFQNTVEMTQPMSQRVVTPKHNAQKFLDDEDDEKGNNPENQKAEQSDEEEEEEESVQNSKKINSFFQPRPKIKSAPKDDNKVSTPKPSDSQPKTSFFAPKPKPPKTKTPILSPKRMKKIKTSGTKKILDNDNSDSDDEATTVVASETKDLNTPSTPFLRAHSPKQKKAPFGIVNASESKTDRINIEEEDPIEEVESSQSQSPMKATSSLPKRGRLSSNRLTSIKRRRLKINESRSALEALEFADARVHHLRSPISVNRKNASNSAIGTTGERSPIRPLKLGLQVEEMAVSTKKWRGLRNDGNSCYVNSSLQQLFSVPNFMQALSKRQEGHELTTSLFQLYENLLQTENSRCASAKPVKKVVDRLTNRFHGYQQRDAHEFLGEVMDQIHEELSKDSES